MMFSLGSCKEKDKNDASKDSKKDSENIMSKEDSKTTSENSEDLIFYVGTYTNGDSKGIYSYSLGPDGKLQKLKLAAQSENPSYLAFSTDRKFLLAVGEIKNDSGDGTVSSFRVEGDSLSLINQSSSGGAHPCFVAVNDSDYVLTANYSGGNIGLLKLNQSGELSDVLDTQQHTGKGSHPRQDAPHAHSAWFYPSSSEVVAVDLGTNQLWFSSIDTNSNTLEPKTPKTLDLNPDDGPRHLTFHPNGKWIYVLNELSNTVALVRYDEKNGFEKGEHFSMLPKNFSGENTGADIHISTDGKFLYASNRGHNSIVIYGVGDKGDLQVLGHESVKGEGPRNFTLSPDGSYLLVANQHSNNIISFKRDHTTGLLSFVDEIQAPSPVCLLF